MKARRDAAELLRSFRHDWEGFRLHERRRCAWRTLGIAADSAARIASRELLDGRTDLAQHWAAVYGLLESRKTRLLNKERI